MESKLKNLKGKMNESVLQDVYFNEKLEQRVLTSIKESKSKIQESPFKYRFNALLSIAVTTMLFLGIAYFVGTQLHLFKEAQGNQASEPKEKVNKETKVETVYVPAKQEEVFKDMTKEEILTKMLNTVDYFETAKGEFKIKYANTPGETLIEYELSLNNQAGGYSKNTNVDNGIKKVTYHYYTDGTIWDINQEAGTYREMNYQQETHSETLNIEDAFSVNSDRDNVTSYRERPFIGEAQSSLFPYEIASNYTRDLNTWEIEKQNEVLLGHNTLVIKGEVNKRNFQSFRFWVDKDSGILVKYETYNSNGGVVDYLYPMKLEINVPIDSKRFMPNLESYKKEEKPIMPNMTTGNIDELIPEELKEQWEETKKKPNETTILNQNGKWYISAKKGYLVDRIEPNGKEGTLYLAKVSAQKSQYIFHALAEGYNVDSLKIVDE